MEKNNEYTRKNMNKKLKEKMENKINDNNNVDPYGYDFVPTISHWTNIDEQRKEANYLENVTKGGKSTNNEESRD